MKRFACIFISIVLIASSACTMKPIERDYPTTNYYKSGNIKAVIKRVNDYFQENLHTNTNSWDDAVYHAGNIRAYQVTGIDDFYQYSYSYALDQGFLVNDGLDTINGDFYCVSQLYIDLYHLLGEDYILFDSIRNADFNSQGKTTFSWVDLLYMGLPVFASLSVIEEDNKYIDDAFRAYMKAREALWDEEDDLWYRDKRFVFGTDNADSITDNGKKVFWSRGNGWAFAALAKSLEILDNEQFAQDFKLMAKAIQNVQRDDGTWNANLGDPKHFSGIESSGTSLFLYGYAVGVRLGLLDFDEYFPTIKKAYDGLLKHAISKEGRLLYVQAGSDSPQRFLHYENEEKRKEFTSQFGVGCFLMAASELMLLCQDYREPSLNPTNLHYTPNPAAYLDKSYYTGRIKASASQEQEGNTASKAVDKNYSNSDGARWSAPNYPNHIILDFEKVLSLRKITISTYQNRAYQYYIEASYDGENYQEIIDNRTNSKNLKFIDHEIDIEARYIKLTVTGCNFYDGNWISINEIFIYTKG